MLPQVESSRIPRITFWVVKVTGKFTPLWSSIDHLIGQAEQVHLVVSMARAIMIDIYIYIIYHTSSAHMSL